MPRLALKLAFGLALVLLWPRSGPAWPMDDLDAVTPEAAEYEALAEALDELGLDLDDPQLEGLDNGELWRIIEEKQFDRPFQPDRAIDGKRDF